MQKVCVICGRNYTGNRELAHLKSSHRTDASNDFISIYVSTDKICSICNNITPFRESIKQHVSRKHMGRAVKEFRQSIH